jgi:hypothetical protein
MLGEEASKGESSDSESKDKTGFDSVVIAVKAACSQEGTESGERKASDVGDDVS